MNLLSYVPYNLMKFVCACYCSLVALCICPFHTEFPHALEEYGRQSKVGLSVNVIIASTTLLCVLGYRSLLTHCGALLLLPVETIPLLVFQLLSSGFTLWRVLIQCTGWFLIGCIVLLLSFLKEFCVILVNCMVLLVVF